MRIGKDSREQDEHSPMSRVRDGLMLEAGEEAAADEVVDKTIRRTESWGDDASESEEGASSEHV